MQFFAFSRTENVDRICKLVKKPVTGIKFWTLLRKTDVRFFVPYCAIHMLFMLVRLQNADLPIYQTDFLFFLQKMQRQSLLFWLNALFVLILNGFEPCSYYSIKLLLCLELSPVGKLIRRTTLCPIVNQLIAALESISRLSSKIS